MEKPDNKIPSQHMSANELDMAIRQLQELTAKLIAERNAREQANKASKDPKKPE